MKTTGDGDIKRFSTRPPAGPQFHRTMTGLTDEDIREELEMGKGGKDFQAALKHEAERRGLV